MAGWHGAVDLESTEDALDAVALAIEAFAVADHRAIGFRRDDQFESARLQIDSNRVGVVGPLGEKWAWRLVGQVDQDVVSLPIRRFPWREVEGDGAASGIIETMSVTGESAREWPRSRS